MNPKTKMCEFSQAETALLAPMAESIQPLFMEIIDQYLPRAIATDVNPQLAIGFLIAGLNAQLASILAITACNIDYETASSLKRDFYEIGSAVQQTIAAAIADMIVELNRKQTEGN